MINLKNDFDSQAQKVENGISRGIHTKGGEVVSMGGNFYSFLGNENLNGEVVPVYEKMIKGIKGKDGQHYTSGGRYFYTGDNNFVLYTEKEKAKNKVAEYNASKRVANNQQAVEKHLETEQKEATAKKEQADQKNEKEDTRISQAFGDRVDENGNKIAGTIKDFANIAQQAGDEYARQKAQREAKMMADQARQQSIASSRASGLSSVSSALLANDNTTSTYNDAYRHAMTQNKGDFMTSYGQGLNLSQSNRQTAINQYDTAVNRGNANNDRITAERDYQQNRHDKAVADEQARVLRVLEAVKMGIMTAGEAFKFITQFGAIGGDMPMGGSMPMGGGGGVPPVAGAEAGAGAGAGVGVEAVAGAVAGVPIPIG